MTNLKSQISNLKSLGFGYLITIIGLFFYSFTQVDLSLTLSQWPVLQVIEKFFQHIGYFQRPLSTAIYVVVISLLFFFYFFFLRLAKIGGIREIGRIWKLIIITTVILTFSYNAFSYDLFNYIFDAKIVTHYHQNPYLHKALDFPTDQMLSFMRSTHRPYPYGPVWLLLTLPLSLGINFFLPTFFLFKAFISASFLGSVYFLEKILQQTKAQNPLFAIFLFGLSPLVLIESLVSAHNDIVMVFFSVLALYLLLKKRYIFSFTFLAVSIGIKFATILLLPVFIYIMAKQLRNNAVNFRTVFMIIFIIMCAAVAITAFASGTNKNVELQPWYFLMVFPFASLISQKRLVVLLTICVSLGMVASYIPYLLMGEWPKDIVDLKVKLLILSIALGVILHMLFSKRFLSYMRHVFSPT